MNKNYRQHAAVTTVIEYLQALQDISKYLKPADNRGDDDLLWFRGQNCESWPLMPKIYRDEFKGADEAEIRDLFQSRAIQLVAGRQPSDEWEWYFKMQHHGVPTRLLDWTESPLIALYFAVRNHEHETDAAVWILDPYWLNLQNTFLRRSGVSGPILPSWREAQKYLVELEVAYEGTGVRMKYPAAIEAPHVDVRVQAQASRFVVFGRERNLSKMFQIHDRHFGLAKIPIREQSVHAIEEELAHLGVHTASVFPDLHGLGQFVCDVWKYRMWKNWR